MSDNLRKQIYFTLNQKDTEELIEIWQDNNRGAWTEEAFGVIREILQERLGDIPAQGEPVERFEEDPADDYDDDIPLDPIEDQENNPVFYQPEKVRLLVKWINRAAIVVVIATLIAGLIELPSIYRIVLSYFDLNTSHINWNLPAVIITIFLYALLSFLQIILIYFPLKALGLILKILMDMEFTSRGVKVENG